jgi:hypothetical protein
MFCQQNVAIKELNVSWNRLRGKGCKAVAEGLSGNVSLQVPNRPVIVWVHLSAACACEYWVGGEMGWNGMRADVICE